MTFPHIFPITKGFFNPETHFLYYKDSEMEAQSHTGSTAHFLINTINAQAAFRTFAWEAQGQLGLRNVRHQ